MAAADLKLPRTLNFLLQALCGRELEIEIRNGSTLAGLLDSVDRHMKYVGDARFVLVL